MKSVFFGLTNAIRAASPAVFSFLEITLPYSTPFPIATITMASAGTFFGLTGMGAFLFVYSLEGIGLVSTSKLVETIVEFIRGRNLKTLIMIVVLAFVVWAYITILVSLNVKIHTEITDQNFSQALTLICYLPLVAGVLNGLSQIKIEYLQTLQEKKEIDEKHWEENFKLKRDVKMARAGATPQQAVRVSKEKMPGDYKEYVFFLLDNHATELLGKDGKLSLTRITDRVNKDKRVEFIHANVKGTWYKFVQEWMRSRQ